MNTRVKSFTESAKGQELREELLKMMTNEDYNTTPSYSTLDPNGRSFVDKHMKYMSQYPTMNCAQYISNLKVMTRRGK